MRTTLNEAAIIYALHNRRKMNESEEAQATEAPYQKSVKAADEKFTGKNPQNPAGTGVKPEWWVMDNFISECPDCGAFIMSAESLEGKKICCPCCNESVLVEKCDQIESIQKVDLKGTGDPNDGYVYHLAADVDGIVDDDDLRDYEDGEEEEADGYDYDDDGYGEYDDEDDEEYDEDDEDEDDDELNEFKIVRGGKAINVKFMDLKKKRRARKKKHGRKGFAATKDGRLVRRTPAQRRADRAFARRMKKGVAKMHRRKSMKRRNRINKRRITAGYQFDENMLKNQINDSLATIFDRYPECIPFQLESITDATYATDTDTMVIESDIRYADGVTDVASFELQGIETGEYTLTEASGDLLDFPVEITGECRVIGESIFFQK